MVGGAKPVDNYFTIKQHATHADRNSLSRAGIHKYSIKADIVGGNSNRQAGVSIEHS